MSDIKCSIKCPICGEILQKYGEIDPDTGTSIVLGANCRKCGIGNSDIKLWQELIRTRKENEDKQAVLNCIVDMLKTLNQRYTLIMGKDVIKETARLLEQTKGGEK